jgi:magnesium chelatase family protein
MVIFHRKTMAAKIFSCFVEGLEVRLIEVEVDILPGLPGLSIVGLGDAAVQEAKERIRSSIKNSGAVYPQQKKIINLAPAHLRKNGACFDVPMAVGLLQASGQLRIPDGCVMAGELALDGKVRAVRGALSMALFAQKNGLDLFLPVENVPEASLIGYPKIYPVRNLEECIGHFRGIKKLHPVPARNVEELTFPEHVPGDVDMNMIQGQSEAKRALQIAAAGGHHVLLYGPPGTGKTLLAQAFQSILPRLTGREMLEVMTIYSAAGLLHANIPAAQGSAGTSAGKEDPSTGQSFLTERPFRKIHQSCSLPALVGGGANAQPGEISLAHHGVLFFDEIAEAPRRLLEALRQPLEEKRITVSRLKSHVEYPANFTLIAAMNPCPCGYYGSQEKPCTCSNGAIVQYHKKLSGPILDRLDLFINLKREPIKISGQPLEQDSAEYRAAAVHARERQLERFKNYPVDLNSQMKPVHIKEFCSMDEPTQNLVTRYAEKNAISARSFHNIIKVARTIADLDGHDSITREDLTEAFQYRIQPTSPLI